MNYIECFNRSRAANYLQPVFFVPGASMLARMEYYARVQFAPVLVPPCCTDGVLRPVPFAPVQGVHPIMLYTL